MSLTLLLPDDDATRDAGAALSERLQPGDCVLLQGPVGAGKSALARAAIQTRMAQAGVIEDVPSPTFTLVQTYDLPGGEVWHADLYRLSAPDEVIELGLEEAFSTAICFVEWPDRLGVLAPANALSITLTPTEDDARLLLLEWTDPRWKTVAEQMKQAGFAQ